MLRNTPIVWAFYSCAQDAGRTSPVVYSDSVLLFSNNKARSLLSGVVSGYYNPFPLWLHPASQRLGPSQLPWPAAPRSSLALPRPLTVSLGCPLLSHRATSSARAKGPSKAARGQGAKGSKGQAKQPRNQRAKEPNVFPEILLARRQVFASLRPLRDGSSRPKRSLLGEREARLAPPPSTPSHVRGEEE